MEIWDLYNEKREKTGETMIRGDKVPKGSFRLVVCLCIFSPDGRMLIQRRALDKEGWSGLWDISCGGSVISGEDSAIGMERELFEELGIRHSFAGERPKVTFSIGQGFVDVYTLLGDYPCESLTLQESEVCDARYATLDEILGLIDERRFIPYHKSIIESMFFLSRSSRLQTEPDGQGG